MKKIAITVIALIVLYYSGLDGGLIPGPDTSSELQWDDANQALFAAIENRRSDVQVRGYGEVKRVLSDDNDGSRHQRFILQLGAGQTVLVAHNIDLAPRVSAIETGDRVDFNGEYEWNPQGGVVHWTHHDPKNRHVNGWLKHKGETYQ